MPGPPRDRKDLVLFSLVSLLSTAYMGEVHSLATLPEATEMYKRGSEVSHAMYCS